VKKFKIGIFCFGILAVLLTGCEGGTDNIRDGETSSLSEGVWKGVVDSNRTLIEFVLNDGEFYFLYSGRGDASLIEGVVAGKSSMSGDTFNSENTLNYNFPDVAISSTFVSGEFIHKKSVSGSITPGTDSSEGVSVYEASYDPAYDDTPLLQSNKSFSGAVSFLVNNVPTELVSDADATVVSLGENGLFYYDVPFDGGVLCVAGQLSSRARGSILDATFALLDSPCAVTVDATVDNIEAELKGIGYFDNNKLYIVGLYNGELINDDGVDVEAVMVFYGETAS